MKKLNEQFDIKQSFIAPFHLPNHSWWLTDWENPVESEWKKAGGRIIRNSAQSILVRMPTLHGKWLPPVERLAGESKPFELYRHSIFIVGRLEQMALSGDSDAALRLAQIATEATVALSRVAREKPGLLLRFSRQRYAWPVIKMAREALSQKEKKLFAAIQLGADAVIELDPQSAKWTWDDAAKIAYLLLTHIEHARRTDKRLAKQFPKFNDDSAKSWWGVAEKLLLFSYPKPETVDEFKALVTARSKRRSPGRLKAAILEKLQSRFLSFARNESFPDLSRVTR